MSTRCRIGYETANGNIKSIYCHHDGYPEGVGAILKEHYTEPAKVAELLELGDISTLGTFYDKKLSEMTWKAFEMDEEKREKLWALTKDMTKTYNDRGENTKARIDKDINEYTDKLGDCWEDYTYLFRQGYDGVYGWTICETPYFKDY